MKALLLISSFCLSSRVQTLSEVLDLLNENAYLTGEMVNYLKLKYTGRPALDFLSNLVFGRGLDDYHDLVYAQNSYINAGILRSPFEIAKILHRIANKVYNEFLENKFLFMQNLSFEQISSYRKILENLDHIINSALGDEKKSVELFYKLVDAGVIDVRDHVDLLKSLSKKGVKKSSSILGEMHMCGHGVEKSREKAMFYFKRGVDAGEAASYNCMGKILMDENLELSRRYLMKASYKGVPSANFNLFMLYDKINLGMQIGMNYLVSSMGEGYLPALFRYGDILYDRGSYEKAIPYLSAVCCFSPPLVRVHRDAEKMFLSGEYARAFALSLLGSELGSETCIKNVLHLLKTRKRLFEGQEAVVFMVLKKYARMGSQAHLVDLGDCYFYGRGVKKDEKCAFGYYAAASLTDSGKGFYYLGYMYQNGLGCQRSSFRALKNTFSCLNRDPNSYILVLYTIIYYTVQNVFLCLPYGNFILATAIFLYFLLLRSFSR